MNNPAPIPFLDAVAADPLLQGQCKAATSLGQLVAVAEAAGFTVSVRDLQLWAHHEAFRSLVAVGRRQQGAAHGIFSWPALLKTGRELNLAILTTVTATWNSCSGAGP